MRMRIYVLRCSYEYTHFFVYNRKCLKKKITHCVTFFSFSLGISQKQKPI